MNFKKKLLSERYTYVEKHRVSFLDDHIYDLIDETREIVSNEPDSRLIHEFCPLCQTDTCTIISEIERYSLPISFQICDGCGLIFSSEYFSAEFAEYFYTNLYNKFKGERTANEFFEHRTSESAYCWKRFQYIKSNLGNAFSDVHIILEPGCNDGCNMFPFYQDGKEVYGCDFDGKRMEPGRKLGMNIYRGGIDVLVDLDLQADLIILSHVIAHIPNLDDFLHKVRNILKPSGWVYIESPGYKWQVQTRKNKRKIEGFGSSNDFLSFLQFEYCYIFELKTLELAMIRNGFILYKGDEVIRSIFKLDSNAKKIDPAENNKRGSGIYLYLLDVEDDYRKISFLKNLKHGLRYYFNKLAGI